MANYDTHYYSRFKLQISYKSAKVRLKVLPLREQPKLPWCIDDEGADASTVTNPGDHWLADWVRIAVQEVGWIPREVYKYLTDEDIGISEFCLLYDDICSQFPNPFGVSDTSHIDAVTADISDGMTVASSFRHLLGSVSTHLLVSHRVFMIHAKPQARTESSDTPFILHYSSHYAEEEFERKLESGTWDNLKEVLLVSSSVAEGRILEENLLKLIVHNS